MNILYCIVSSESHICDYDECDVKKLPSVVIFKIIYIYIYIYIIDCTVRKVLILTQIADVCHHGVLYAARAKYQFYNF